MQITSLDNPKIKLLIKLKETKYRKKEKMFVVEGKHLVKEALNLGLLIEAYSIEEKPNYITVTKEIMKKIANTDTVVSEIGLCKIIENNKLSNKILILDKIQDPGNMGALMRSSKAFGFDTLILGEGCVDIYNDKVIRSSQGAIFKLNFINKNLLEFIPTLTDYDVYGTDVINGIDVKDICKADKVAVVLGNEGNGIDNNIKKLLKNNIYIKMNNMESLNVSVAGSIIMYMFSLK